jgi:hypothetical protein
LSSALDDPWTAFRPNSSDRELITRHAMKSESFRPAGTFTVTTSTPVAEVAPTLYMKVNGEIPGLKPEKGGVSERPMVFTWYVGPEFPFPKSNLSYRYRLSPDEDEWSEWSPKTQTGYFFLPKGAHEFSAQARYQTPEKTTFSAIARWQFILESPLVARATKGSFEIGPIVALPVPDIDTIYSGSRALLIGISQFDDKRFSMLPADRIERDVQTLKTALADNGFQVTTFVKPRVTRDDVTSQIENLVRTSRANDRLFIYFSTHGFADPDVPSKGYLAVSDCEYGKPSAKCIALDSMRSQLDAAIGRNVRQIVIAVDSCFSGLGVIVKSPPVLDLSALSRRQGIYMLTAGMENQEAQIDPELKMSTFTHYLANGLQTREADFLNYGVVTLTELFLYTQFHVAERTKAAQIPMMGRIFGSGEMLFRPPTSAKGTHLPE